ncbi:MAG: ATP-binding protein [bacterium]|nr:ATP-binding protein [bacterium]
MQISTNYTKKTIFILLRWMIVFVVLLLFVQNQKLIFDSPFIAIICIAYCLSGFMLNFIDDATFEKPWVVYSIFISDTLFASLAIYYTGGMDSDFYLIYFLAILMAAIGQNTYATLIVATVACAIYGMMVFKSQGSIQYLLNPGFLIRFPFFYIIALSSSFQSQEIRKKQVLLVQSEHDKEILEKEINKATYALHETNDKLKNLNEYYNHILQSITNGLIVIDNNGIITKFNKTAEKILELDSQKLEGKPILSIPAIKKLGEDIFFTMGEKESKKEMLIQTENGHSVPLEIKNSVLRDYEGKNIGSLCVFTDQTLEKEMEHQLKQSHQLAELGEITSTVAHEIKNPVQVILSISDILNENTEVNAPCKKYTEVIIKQAQKLSDLIVSILSFTKSPVLFKSEQQINTLLLKTVSSLKNSVKKKEIKLEVTLAENLPMTTADGPKIEQVFSNIFVNAIDAVEDEGIIKIQSSFDKEHISVRFIDNGKGIPSEIMKKIFDPFFTTKSDGTGVGLTLSKKIIEIHGGEIKVSSCDKGETCFEIVLPRKDIS